MIPREPVRLDDQLVATLARIAKAIALREREAIERQAEAKRAARLAARRSA